MKKDGPRVFIYIDLMSELEHISKMETNHSLGQAASTPLYVLLNLDGPAAGMDMGLHDEPDGFMDAQDLEELFAEEDGELIGELEAHPEIFRAVPFELDDGSEAVAYDFANRSLYTMRRIQDEADWMLAMRTYDPTWVIGPSIPKVKGLPTQRKKLRGVLRRKR
jgi:hypothetical protein